MAPPCKNGNTCSASVAATSGSTPQFSAAIGAVPSTRNQSKLGQLLQKVTGPTTLIDVQARSAAIQPARLLWGVDSCKAFTGDPTGEVLPGVQRALGNPDFWGRYLTSTVCPGLSWPEIYTTDEDRRATVEQAALFGDIVRTVYERLGYRLIDVPKDGPDARAAFVRGLVRASIRD